MLLFRKSGAPGFVGPYNVFSRATDYFEVMNVSEDTSIVTPEGGLQLKATPTFEQYPRGYRVCTRWPR